MIVESLFTIVLATLASAQTTSLGYIFLLPGPDIPQSIEASVVTSFSTSLSKWGITYRAACPTGASPENDACHALGLYPMDIYQTQGGTYGGTMTDPKLGQTTTWECDIATWGYRTWAHGACTSTIMEGSRLVRNESTTFADACISVHAKVPLVVTAGLEKLQLYTWKGQATAVSEYLDGYWKSDAASLGCVPRPTLTAGTGIASIMSGTTVTSTAGLSTASIDTRSSSITVAPLLPASGSSAIPTTSSKNAGGRGFVMNVEVPCLILEIVIGLSFIM